MYQTTFPCKLTENAKQNIDSNVASITALLGQDWVADINPSYLTIPNTQFDVVWYIPVPEDQLLSIASTAKSFQSADLSEDQIKSETVRRCVLDQEKTVENLKSLLRNPLIETCVQMEWRDAGIEFRKKKKRVMPTETKVHEV